MVNDRAFSLSHDERPASAHHVVQECLTAVGIEQGQAGSGIDHVRQVRDELLRLLPLVLEVRCSADAFGHREEPLVTCSMSDQRVECGRFPGLQRGLEPEEAGRRASHRDLRLRYEICQSGPGEVPRLAQRSVLPEHQPRVHQSGQAPRGTSILGKREVEVPRLELHHLRRVSRARPQPVERDASLQVEHLHPRFERAADLLQPPIVRAIGDHSGHTVQQLERDGAIADVRDSHLPHESGELFARQHEVEHVRLHTLRWIGGLQLQLIQAHEHLSRFIALPRRERLIQRSTLTPGQLEECSESRVRSALVGLVGGQKLHDRVVFVADAKAGDGLSTVDVEDPHRRPERTGNARQKAGERQAAGEALQDESLGIVE